MTGTYYTYIESGGMDYLENALLVSNILQQGELGKNKKVKKIKKFIQCAGLFSVLYLGTRTKCVYCLNDT